MNMFPLIEQWICSLYSYFHMPQRIVLSIFGMLAIVNAYTMRSAMDITLPQLIGPNCDQHCLQFGSNGKRNDSITFKVMQDYRNAALKRLVDFNVIRSTRLLKPVTLDRDPVTPHEGSISMKFLIHTAFSIGYVISQLPAALLADRYGGKCVLAVGMLMTAILTILTPTAIKMGGPLATIFVRFLVGVFEGPTYPALSALLSHWVPACERGKLAVLVLSGGQLGLFVSNIMSGMMIQSFDWSLIFYYFGGCALIWLVGFVLLCYNEPESNPFIDDFELEYLCKEVGCINKKKKRLATPWKNIFKNGPMWALISATVQYDWTQAIVAAELPKFVKDAKKITLNQSITASFDASVPYILNWVVSLMAGILSDILINRKILSITVTRKFMSFITALGPNTIMSFASCLSCNDDPGVRSIFNCALGLMGTYYAGIKLSPLDLSPNFASILMAIANSLGSLTTILAPFLQQIIPQELAFNEVRSVLLLISAVMISGEVQPFNDPDSSVHKID